MAEPLPPSLWAATAEPASKSAVLEGETSVDVAIVGGGFCGLSAALHLAEGGAGVAVLEAREPGWGASGRNGGQVIPGFKDPPSVLRRLYGEDLGQRMATLGAEAGDVVHDIITRHGIRCQYRRQGWINAIHGTKALALAEQRAAEWQALGAPIRMLDRRETASLIGTDGYIAGYLDPRGAALNPLSYARGLARAAMASGAAIYGRAPVRAFERRGNRWRLSAPGGIVSAAHVLVATGAYSDGVVPGLERTILPVQSIQVATRPLSDNVRATVLPKGHVASDMRRLVLYFRLDEDGRLVFGGRGSIRSEAVKPAHVSSIVAAMRRTFPQIGDIAIDYVWAGQVDVTPGRRLRVYELGPGLWAVIGFSGRGVAQATAVGKAMAGSLAKGGLDALPLPVVPLRPLPLHALRLPAMAAVTAWSRIVDRLETVAAGSRFTSA
jgi:glycine/D-amino acid oxidase-like deaminating enzyme